MLSFIIGLFLMTIGLLGAGGSEDNPIVRFLVMVGIFFMVFGLYSCAVNGY